MAARGGQVSSWRHDGRWLHLGVLGQTGGMGIVVVLLVLALIFGVGSVVEGLLWGFLIVTGLVVAAAVLGYRALSSSSRR